MQPYWGIWEQENTCCLAPLGASTGILERVGRTTLGPTGIFFAGGAWGKGLLGLPFIAVCSAAEGDQGNAILQANYSAHIRGLHSVYGPAMR